MPVNRNATRLLLSELIPYPGNPRRGDVAAIAESLTRNGQFQPLIVQRSTAYVLSGNHTLEAMLSLGWEEADVDEIDVDEQTARRIVAAANRTADLGTYDNHDLVALLQSIDDLEGTGYSDDNLATFLTNLDEHNFPPADPADDPRLDRKNLTTCPSCGHEFEPTTYAAPA
jgi:hypothetical protein